MMEAIEWATGEITLSAAGAPVKLELSIPLQAVKPQVMLPVHKMANTFTDLGVLQVEQMGETISCSKGCGACCRQPVPLAETEIYHIASLVASMPEPRRTEIERRFEAAAAHFRSNGWVEKLQGCTREDELKVLIREYFLEHIACPFLENESCSIHLDRPVICREFLVTSPAINCSSPTEETVRQVPLPITVSEGLTGFSKSGNLVNHQFLPMVLALEWAKSHPENFQKKTGEQWLGEFFGG